MILKNNAACLIAINTSPILSQKQIDALRQNNRPIPSSFVNIPPLEAVEVSDEHCQSDFVQNLIEIGELTVVSRDSGAKPKKEETKASKKDTQSDLDAARDEAELNGVEWKKTWSVQKIYQEIDKNLA